MASMEGVNFKHALVGCSTLIVGGCGMFLFCLLNSAEEANHKTILTVGVTGAIR